MNQVSLIGRLVRPIELQEIGRGRFVCNNTLAINRIGRKEEGQQTADFIPVVFWDKSAHLLKEFCDKGSLIGVNGKLQSRSYTNKQHQQIYVVELLVETMHFIDTRKKSTSQPQAEPEHDIPVELPF